MCKNHEKFPRKQNQCVSRYRETKPRLQPRLIVVTAHVTLEMFKALKLEVVLDVKARGADFIHSGQTRYDSRGVSRFFALQTPFQGVCHSFRDLPSLHSLTLASIPPF